MFTRIPKKPSPSDFTMHVPRVSIGLPVYNGANFLGPSIDSILQQDYTEFELIIADNASTDETPLICQAFSEKDRRILYLRNESNIGAAGNFNRVFQLARGEFFMWAAHDDVHLPGFLRRCVEVLDHAPSSVVLVAPRAEIIDENGKKIIKEGWQPESLDTRRSRPHQRVADVLRNIAWATAQFGVYRSEALRKTRLIDRFLASDHVLLLELAILGEIREIPEVLFQRRYHPGISTNVNRTEAEFQEWWDPSQKPKGRFFPRMKLALLPRTRLLREFSRSVGRMPLSPKERLLCFFTAWSIWFSRESLRLRVEYVSRLQHKLKKALVGSSARQKQA